MSECFLYKCSIFDHIVYSIKLSIFNQNEKMNNLESSPASLNTIKEYQGQAKVSRNESDSTVL